jgi:hypothetical protein
MAEQYLATSAAEEKGMRLPARVLTVLDVSCRVPDILQELPASGLSIERELDEVVPVLLKKAGDLSTAGVHPLNPVSVFPMGCWLETVSNTAGSRGGRGMRSVCLHAHLSALCLLARPSACTLFVCLQAATTSLLRKQQRRCPSSVAQSARPGPCQRS